ncbi:MAG: PhnD/SsuA/transferrin family substrate-binding protein [Chloroflexota bacterium]|nr:PhnD/SsuA/transferrin family substrate-binding protein [Chloroflexota bacterium]
MTHLRYRWFALLVVVLLLVGCRRGAEDQVAARPTTAVTPRSTHLPPVPTAVPVGSEDNPLQVMLLPSESGRSQRAITQAADDLQPALAAASGLTIELTLADSDADVLAALCASTPESVTVGWMSGVGYAAAAAADCGTAALQVARGAADGARTGDDVTLVVNRDADIAAIADIDGKTFCRLDAADLQTNLIPSVMLRASSGETPVTPLETTDYDDLDTLIDALVAGECDAAGMSAAAYDERANAAVRAATVALTPRSAEIPFAVLMIPSFLPLAQRASLIDAFVTIGNGAQADSLRPILAHDEIVRAEDADFVRLRTFFSQAGIDLAALGT